MVEDSSADAEVLAAEVVVAPAAVGEVVVDVDASSAPQHLLLRGMRSDAEGALFSSSLLIAPRVNPIDSIGLVERR